MLERLEKSALEQIILAKHELHWYKPGKEIMVKNVLFDVHSHIITGDSVVVTGLFDPKETSLKIKLANFWDQKSSMPSSNEISITKFLLTPWFDNKSIGTLIFESWLVFSSGYKITSGKLLSGFASVAMPPPKNSSSIDYYLPGYFL